MHDVNSALILYYEVTVDDGIQFASPQTFVAVIVDGRSKIEEWCDREFSRGLINRPCKLFSRFVMTHLQVRSFIYRLI